jgi:chemotaxis protein CheZ
MAIGNTQNFDELIDFLREKRENVTFADVIKLAEVAAQSLQSFFETMDHTVYRELHEIASYIDTMKGEIGALRPNELKDSRIPSAGQELSAIVSATEKATNAIMECAETVMAADAANCAAYKATVDEQMLVIFEACSFQDITGQRIAKVVETLQHIEERVARFAHVMKATDLEGFLSDNERMRAERRERLLLHGPQREGERMAQTDIDSLLADRDDTAPTTTPQAEIDALFK